MDETILSHYKMLARVRRDALYKDGEMRLLCLNDSLLAFSREDETSAAVTVLNNGSDAVSLLLPETATVLTDTDVREGRVVLSPLEGAVIKIKRTDPIIFE
jgi:hypothetical protein